jgi:hypothetical protein
MADIADREAWNRRGNVVATRQFLQRSTRPAPLDGPFAPSAPTDRRRNSCPFDELDDIIGAAPIVRPENGKGGMKFVKRIGGALAIAAALMFSGGLPAPSAQAAYTVSLQQEGSDVVATGAGTLDTTDLGQGVTDTDQARMSPMSGSILTGPATTTNLGVFSGITGPTSFGSGSSEGADSGSGDPVGILAGAGLVTPQEYLSGSALSSTATWANQTFTSLGVTAGSYTWSWGSGTHSDFFSLDIIEGAAVVPEPSSILLLALPLGLAMLFFCCAGVGSGAARWSFLVPWRGS